MTVLSVLLLGIGLGFRHAADADHVVAVSTLVQREPGVWRAARIAALWGAGHTAAFLAVGLWVVVAGVRLPPQFEPCAQLLVAAMLIGIGLRHLARGREVEVPNPSAAAGRVAPAVLVGLVHGLGGSAGVAVVTATTIVSRPVAAAYLALFGLGTVLGMVALTVVLSRPLGWSMRHPSGAKHATTLAAVSSALLGASILLRLLLDLADAC